MISGVDDLWSVVYLPTSLPLCLKCSLLPVAYRALNAITPDGSLMAPWCLPGASLVPPWGLPCIPRQHPRQHHTLYPYQMVSTVLFVFLRGNSHKNKAHIRVQRGHHKINPLYVSSSELGRCTALLQCTVLLYMHALRRLDRVQTTFGNIGSTDRSKSCQVM